MVEVGFAGLSWHCRFGNAVHLVNANYVNVADSTTFWRENDNLLIFLVNSDNWSCSGMSQWHNPVYTLLMDLETRKNMKARAFWWMMGRLAGWDLK